MQNQENSISEFLIHHMVQIKTKLFDNFKVYFRSDCKSLSFSHEQKSLFCSLCLCFGLLSGMNTFERKGMNDWKHVHQRIIEHENSKRQIVM